jgi:transcriptional regulator with XRE-family HTH domain
MALNRQTPGELLRDSRTGVGLTQHELASLVGRPQSLVSRVERDRVSPTIATLTALLQPLGFDVSLHVNASASALAAAIAALGRDFRDAAFEYSFSGERRPTRAEFDQWLDRAMSEGALTGYRDLSMSAGRSVRRDIMAAPELY